MTAPLLHHRIDGPPGAPPLLLGPSVGTSLAVWDPQVPELARVHRVIRYDLPGHGGTPADVLPSTEPGATTVADLVAPVLALADHLGLDRFAYAGISLGGAVGAWLAVHHPERIASLAMICSSARFGEPEYWHERATLVRANGTEAVVPTVWFTGAYASSGSPAVAQLRADLRSADNTGYAACCDALAAYDLVNQLHRITAPTLIVAGREDPATPPEHARLLADRIPGAGLLEVGGAAHLAGVERPAPVTAALLVHLGADAVPADHGTRHAAGMAVRREVLGDAHVDDAQQRTTTFTARFQDFITDYAWGEIWTDPTLSRRERSLITLTALVARGHHDELAMHVRAAVNNGLSPEEIAAALLQTAVYCGVPAANTAFAVAQRTLEEEEH
ncbi:bifunctional 3-oxoadipate enol-lactonase/4-carboxymuconolactone decarboxylase PcaDC [Streptomyces sp. 8N616]|uniref:bifunctional 3-oxoadipate enol-lactonase/4-carboxymuconolactone decarboxylase PcaDC n=1 Tax=Streptomyces sp. 8N616 TaxID=3457414 RepID=UPI003FD1E9D9